MQNILLIGAGRSASSLIQYLISHAREESWYITLAEFNVDLAQSHLKEVPQQLAKAIFFDVNDEKQRGQEIEKADLVVSMLPARMHHLVAKDCVRLGKNMVTASYVSEDLKELHEEALDKGILLLNEMGLDPGIDHMSAMQMINEVKEKGFKIEGFESFTGGLVAPEYDDNPWKYKFTWNPRNVVLAGQGGTVKFLHNGRYKYIPYNKLFRRTEKLEIDGFGRFEGYANRDSLNYIDIYGLEGTPTVYRGTLRRPGFCKAWDCFVQLGLTDDSFVMEDTENMTYREFINSFLAYNPHDSVELKTRFHLKLDHDSEEFEKINWLGIFSDKKIGLKNATPAQILQKILEEKWSLKSGEKDMIVMYHKLFYHNSDKDILRTSHMVVKGDDDTYTAMAKTVGLPMAIACKLILQGKVNIKGVQIPVHQEIYEPVLKELETLGIQFVEKEVDMHVKQESSL